MKPLSQKRAEAEARLAAWRALSPREQLAELDRRLGPGVGARRQRRRIEKALLEEEERLVLVHDPIAHRRLAA